MHVVAVVCIDIAVAERAFTDRAERDFAQTADLAHDRGVRLVVEQVHLLVVLGLPQQFALLQFLADLLRVFRRRDRFARFEYRALVARDPVEVSSEHLRGLCRRNLQLVAGFVFDPVADPELDRVLFLLEHFVDQPQRRQRLREDRQRVEEHRVAAVDVDRQNR